MREQILHEIWLSRQIVATQSRVDEILTNRIIRLFGWHNGVREKPTEGRNVLVKRIFLNEYSQYMVAYQDDGNTAEMTESELDVLKETHGLVWVGDENATQVWSLTCTQWMYLPEGEK